MKEIKLTQINAAITIQPGTSLKYINYENRVIFFRLVNCANSTFNLVSGDDWSLWNEFNGKCEDIGNISREELAIFIGLDSIEDFRLIIE